jgi:hypothetical protein
VNQLKMFPTGQNEPDPVMAVKPSPVYKPTAHQTESEIARIVAALESLKASLATYERHVPRESRQIAEDRDWFEEMAIRLSELGVNI